MRKSKYPIAVSIYLSEQMNEIIRAVSDKEEISMAEKVREILNRWMDTVEE